MVNGFRCFRQVAIDLRSGSLRIFADAAHLTEGCERPCDQPGSLQRPDPTEESGLGSP
jgi:hypothetical protein